MNERVAPPLPSSADRKPVTDLRAWLDVLAGSDRLAVGRPGVNLRVAAPSVPKKLAARKPVTDWRAWLDVLAGSDRLAVARPGVNLRFELAAIAKKLDGEKATFFPRPDGHTVPVISGLTSDRGWMAEARGVSNDRLLAP